ncbi:hypothetical protein LWI29_030213 [Acer saccharum]|uniref:Uncharacterized protein n=1 Tax=Acer saccharum TaxID=4024 RepID=A0AA39VYJ4_ACESA|nr:hypothetical protein LWI29_030213 [Acer saccharum]
MVAALHANLSLWRPYLSYQPGKYQFLNGANFASAGASVLPYNDPEVAKFPPYGETFFKYPTGRFCDGRIIPDFTALHANLSLWRPYLSYQPGKYQFLNGANFASAGASVLPYNDPEVLHLDIQLGFFKNVAGLWRQKLGDAEANKRLNNAVFLISIGGVDYMTYSSRRYAINATEYVNWVIGNITYTITEIYETGGRKFAFQNVAPLGCTPEAKQTYNLSDDECEEELLEMATLHNNALFNAAKELEIQLPAFKYLIFDYYNLLYDRIKHPSKYGERTEEAIAELENMNYAVILISICFLMLNIRIQLGYLKEVANLLKEELGDTEAKNILENAIYLSSFGGVDYMAFINNTYTHFTQSKMEEYVKMVLGNLTEVTKVYWELESQLSGFNYMNFDFFNALNDMTSHLESYGFKVSDIACRGTGSHRGSGCGRVTAYELCSDPILTSMCFLMVDIQRSERILC